MKFVAVTACPTGIAHTYMAAEALEEEAKKRGHEIAVETQGSAGSEKVNDSQISGAVGVIYAVDTNVDGRERFSHLPSVEVTPGEAINHAARVLDRAEKAVEEGVSEEPAETAASGRGGGGAAAAATGGGGGDGPGRSSKTGMVRQWLMTGVSYMLPFVTAGGILIALAFLVGDTVEVVNEDVYEQFSFGALFFKIGSTAFQMIGPILGGFIAYAMADRPGIAPGIVAGLLANDNGAGFLGAIIGGLLAGAVVLGLKRVPFPASLRSLLPVLFYPLIATFVVGTIMILVVGEPIAAATDALTSWLEGMGTANAIVLGVILGLMMAFDMGGPVNKVAYFFGVGLVAESVYAPMAAVMAAGMTPPLGLALATVVRKRLFNVQEQEAGKAAWVMGASFITEGAIPFAAADPIRVIPALMAGSAVAGGLSMAFDATLQAPHGGIFVFPLVGNPFLYVLAIAIGTVVTAVSVILLKEFRSAQDETADTTDETTEAARA
ncbi:MAG: fructose-specific PTS transporter subunit EIIC [Actinobacteria bacterium]|nr:fructose-specific PTS transporter subunit EIIC [Actinomycetota bacterium]